MSKKIVFILVFIISALTLQLELLQARIFSIVLWYNFVYIVVTMALLGFAASGTALSVSTKLRNLSDPAFYFLSILGFSVTSFYSSKYACFPIQNSFSLVPTPQLIFFLIVSYTISMVPYFFAGLAIIGSFVRRPGETSRLYFSNLLGSGLGCLAFVFLIGFLGGSKLLLFSSLLCVIGLLPVIKNNIRMQLILMPWLLFLVIGLILPSNNSQLKQMLPERHKQFWVLFPGGATVEYSEWNPISRIDVISSIQDPSDKRILMDGDAQAMLFDLPMIKDRSMWSFADRNAAYSILGKKSERTLIIGAGGGFDVGVALINGSLEVDAVEINPTTARVASEIYYFRTKDTFASPRTHLFVEDGRSFVKRSKKEYDIIMMCATDSFLALSTGAYVLSDSYLYTKEALQDYLDHITEGGFIQIGRWLFSKRPRETLRIFTTALEALRDRGVTDPLSNVVVISPYENWADVIIKKRPFTPDELERLRNFCAQYDIKILYPAALSQSDWEKRVGAPFLSFADNFFRRTERVFYEQYDYNVFPVSDDSPFFYQYDKWGHAKQNENFQHSYFDKIRGVWYLFILFSLVLHSIIMSLILVILPLVISKKSLKKTRLRVFIFIYFCAIGCAFMFFEMGIVQKCVLFLGNPIYSMAVIIPAILICAGGGSLFSHRIRSNIRCWMVAAVGICGFLILMINNFMPEITGFFFAYPLCVRIPIVVIAILPLAFFMGMPFPLAIRLIAGYQEETIPWAWAINGSASVIASVFAIIIAMQFGFKAVLVVSAIFYLVAGLAIIFFLKADRA